MNLKRKPPTVRQNHAKKPRPSDEKAAANALLLLVSSKNDVGKTDNEIIAAEMLLSFDVDAASTNGEVLTVGIPDRGISVCTNEKESNVTFINGEQEIHEQGNEQNETSTIRSTQVILFCGNTPTLIININCMVNANCYCYILF